MPLHVNLHHEIDQQELARRRDPLRIALLVALVIATCLAAYYFWVLGAEHSVNVRYANLSDQWSKMEKKFNDAKTQQAQLEEQIKASDALMDNINGRFYWAPILDDVLKTVPPNIQVVRLNADSQQGINNVLTVAGLASGVEPRKEAEAVRIALAKKLAASCKHVTSSFQELDDSDQFVMLDGRRLPTATFTMEFELQVREPASTPAPGPVSKPRGEGASE